MRHLSWTAGAVACLLSATACDRVAEGHAAAAEPAGTGTAAPASPPSSDYSTSAWIDLRGGQLDAEVSSIRKRLLDAAGARELDRARSVGFDIERQAHAAASCELRGPQGASGRVLVFYGQFTDESLKALSQVFPSARWETSPRGPLLNVGSAWLARSPEGLTWADTRSSLERAMAGGIAFVKPEANQMLVVATRGERATSSFAALAKSAGLAASTLQSVVLSAGKDGQSSELQITTASSEDATALLGVVQPAFREVREHPRTASVAGADRVTVEANDRSVMVRAQVPLKTSWLCWRASAAKKRRPPDTRTPEQRMNLVRTSIFCVCLMGLLVVACGGDDESEQLCDDVRAKVAECNRNINTSGQCQSNPSSAVVCTARCLLNAECSQITRTGAEQPVLPVHRGVQRGRAERFPVSKRDRVLASSGRV